MLSLSNPLSKTLHFLILPFNIHFLLSEKANKSSQVSNWLQPRILILWSKTDLYKSVQRSGLVLCSIERNTAYCNERFLSRTSGDSTKRLALHSFYLISPFGSLDMSV